MDATTLECFRKQLELLETELRADVEGQAAATAPVQVDSSINVAFADVGKIFFDRALQADSLETPLAETAPARLNESVLE
jgi:hypothetical protein